MDRTIALQGGLGSVAPPDQIIGWTGVETLGLTAGGIHDHRPAGRGLIAITAQGAAIKAAVLEGGPATGAALAIRTARTPLTTAAATTAAGAIKARTIEAGTIRGRTIRADCLITAVAGCIETAFGAGALAVTLRARAISTLRPPAEGGTIGTLAALTTCRTVGPPFAARGKWTTGAAA